MLNWIISWSLQNRLIVLVAWAAMAALGVFALRSLTIDAFPDTTPAQVQINTGAAALNPQEIELQITKPVEQSISGLPNLKNVKSISKFGLSQVVVTFEDGTDILSARNLVNERLSTVKLPPEVARPQMGPITTGLGEVLHYAIVATEPPRPDPADPEAKPKVKKDLMELRTFHDWTVRPTMRTIPGVAEINSWGGLEKQYQVRVDPEKLLKYSVTFQQIQDALAASNFNVGGGSIRYRGEALTIHGIGKTNGVEPLGNIVIDNKGGTPVLLQQVAEVKIGHEIRRGAVTADGKGEVVLGLGFMLMGENSHEVTRRMNDKLTEVEHNLPEGFQIVRLYDRTELVDHVIETVKNNLFEGGLLVVAVLFIFLGNLRAGLIVAMAIPFSMVFAFAGMWKFAIAGSLLSLGALDFGLVVDSSVVLIENCVRRLSEHHHSGPILSKSEVIRDAAIEVRKPTLFGELIILIVYIPILSLDGVAGKMYRPMALTVIFALIGSMFASLTLMPVLASLFLPRRMQETEPLPVRVSAWAIMPLFRLSWHFRFATILLAITGLACAIFLALGRGGQFLPTLSEGAMALNVKRLAGIDIDEVVRRNTLMEQQILEKFPTEVEHVWSRCGVADVATDPMGVEETDMFLALKPRDRWRKQFKTQDDLRNAIQEEIDQPGQTVLFEQPISQRVNEMTSGVKGSLAIKVYGDDFDKLTNVCDQIEKVLKQLNKDAKVTREQLGGAPVLQIELNLEAMARYNLPARTVLDYVEAIGSKPAGDVVEDPLRFPLIIRLSERWRTKEEIGNIPIPTPRGEVVPLGRVTRIHHLEGPASISREWGQRRTILSCEVKTDDMAGFVAEARKQVNAEVKLPEDGRYRIEWSGTYEYLDAAMQRLKIVVPLALVAIFVLLYMTFHSIGDALRIYTGVPFAMIGGVAAMVFRDMPFSVSAAVGFIAVSGVSVLNGMLLVTFVRQLREQGEPLEQAVRHAVRARLRPVLMTAMVASLGFVPMALSTGMGAEVQRPLATVVIGGIFTSTVMTLLVLPVVYRFSLAGLFAANKPES